MGTGYKGNATSYHSIGDNAYSLKEVYEFNERTGYFGKKGQSRKEYIRNISTDDSFATAKDFYKKASYGGIEIELSNGKGVRTKMKDGTYITYRELSSSDGSPAVDINISSVSSDNDGIKRQKIHFVQIGG